jgi:hypothetical protein
MYSTCLHGRESVHIPVHRVSRVRDPGHNPGRDPGHNPGRDPGHTSSCLLFLFATVEIRGGIRCLNAKIRC